MKNDYIADAIKELIQNSRKFSMSPLEEKLRAKMKPLEDEEDDEEEKDEDDFGSGVGEEKDEDDKDESISPEMLEKLKALLGK